MENEILKLSDITKCYICGSNQKRSDHSLHCWDIEYNCGCIIFGYISNDKICLDNPCPNIK